MAAVSTRGDFFSRCLHCVLGKLVVRISIPVARSVSARYQFGNIKFWGFEHEATKGNHENRHGGDGIVRTDRVSEGAG